MMLIQTGFNIKWQKQQTIFPEVPSGSMTIQMLCFQSPTVEHWSQCTKSIFADGLRVGQESPATLLCNHLRVVVVIQYKHD